VHAGGVCDVPVDDRGDVAVEKPPAARRGANTCLREAAREEDLRVLVATDRRIEDRWDLTTEQPREEVLPTPVDLALGERPQREVVDPTGQRVRDGRNAA